MSAAGAAVDLDRLAAAKLWLVDGCGDLPYLATALYALHAVGCPQVPRMAADPLWRLYVNPTWLALSDVPTVATELAHVTWHLLLEHAERARAVDVGTAESAAWRTATDVTVSETLQDGGLPTPGLPTAQSLRLSPRRSAEEHFARLSRLPASPSPTIGTGGPEPPDGCGSAADGLPRGYELPAVGDVPTVATVQADEIRRAVAIAFTEHVTSVGTQAGDALRWVSTVLDPVVPWHQVLTAAVRRAAGWAHGHTDYTYSRPSRRQAASRRVILPATRRPVPCVALVVDTSASVDDGLLAQALGEVDGAIAGLGVPGAQVSVLSCDAAVHTVSSVRHAREVRLGGGGGTDLRLGLAAATRLRPRPDVVVVLTDGYTPWPEQPPAGAAVVVAVLQRPGIPPPPTPSWSLRVDCALS